MIIINIGATGTGKTTRAVNLCNLIRKEKIIFDIQGEYIFENEKKCYWYNETQTEKILIKNVLSVETDINEFFNLVDSEEIFNTVFLAEEASIFFSLHDSQTIIKALVSNRHRNNDIIFNFHSLRSVPVYIIDYANYFILGKTNDQDAAIKRKYNEIFLNKVKEVKRNKSEYFFLNIERKYF